MNTHKRQGSPSMLILDDKSSKKRHCTTDGYQLNVDGEISCSSQEGYHRNMQSGVVAKSGAAIFNSKEVNVI